jgi:SAM-dependent methyltransferase
MPSKNKYFIEAKGWCPICDKEVIFQSKYDWLRDHFKCSNCRSIPRERALMYTIKTFFPNFEELTIHESSPCSRGVSVKLKSICPNYDASHFYKNLPLGKYHPTSGYRCEDLERLTFRDSKFDIFITQDVMEHIFKPTAAFKEIARVLKPGGAHIFTAPLINKNNKSERWASIGKQKEVIFHHEPEYHGNPIDNKGSLVTMHWGYDITDYILEASGMHSTIVMIDNIELGIRAEYIDVIVSFKR